MKKKLIAIAAALVAIVPLTGGNASAAAEAGALAFECTAELSAFPTAAGSGVCEGDVAPAVAGGAVVGTSTTGPFAITGSGSFFAEFTYAEGCVANEPPALGTASGTATVSGMAAVNNGVSVTASATINFNWTRVGLTAAIVITGGQISFSDGATATLGTSAATAGFAPLLQQNNTCPDGGPLKAIVAGTATVAGV